MIFLHWFRIKIYIFTKILFNFIFIFYIILFKVSKAGCGVSFLPKGGDAYARTDIYLHHIHTSYWICIFYCISNWLICCISLNHKKIRQQKKYISAWPLEIYLIYLNTYNGTPLLWLLAFVIFIILESNENVNCFLLIYPFFNHIFRNI